MLFFECEDVEIMKFIVILEVSSGVFSWNYGMCFVVNICYVFGLCI